MSRALTEPEFKIQSGGSVHQQRAKAIDLHCLLVAFNQSYKLHRPSFSAGHIDMLSIV